MANNWLTNREYRILVDGELVPADLITWARWFEDGNNRRVAETFVGDVRISTVVLGADHSFGFAVKPLWFETMIFGGDHDQYQDRYETLEEAMQGHEKAVAVAKGEIEPD